MGSIKSKKTTFYSRRANYAGSWYDASSDQLDASLEQFLKDANQQDFLPSSGGGGGGAVRFLVAPHAGFAYSGSTAAHAHRVLHGALQDDTTIVVLHPSHCSLASLPIMNILASWKLADMRKYKTS